MIFLESALCRLTCVARETGDIFESPENVVDGTACSYERSNGICIQVFLLPITEIPILCPVLHLDILFQRANVK